MVGDGHLKCVGVVNAKVDGVSEGGDLQLIVVSCSLYAGSVVRIERHAKGIAKLERDFAGAIDGVVIEMGEFGVEFDYAVD